MAEVEEREGESEEERVEFRRKFWDIICEYDEYLKGALAISFFLLAMLLMAAPGIARGTDSFVVLVLDLAILGPLLVVSVFLVWRCRNRERERRF